MPRPRRLTSKAGRNEGRKLMAALVNSVAAAAILAAFLQPVLAFLRQHQPFRSADVVASLLLFALAAILAFGAQMIARRLED